MFTKDFLKSKINLTILITISFIFWSLRISYWTKVHEVPFSDMNDYLMVTHNILKNFSFAMDSFWQSYKPPTLPAFGALIFYLFGYDNFEAYRFCIALLLFFGILILINEIYKISKSRFLAFSLFFIVAITKSSIFWSYKFSTESLAEGLLYYTLAFSLLVLNNPNKWSCFALGISMALNALNRPQYAILIPIFGIIFLFINRNQILQLNRKLIKYLLIIGFGLSLVWTPWITRTYRIYGHPMMGNTSTPFNFLFELGTVELKENGKVIDTKDNYTLLVEAKEKFSNDYEAQVHGRKYVKSWLNNNFKTYLDLIFKFRIEESLFTDHIYLTKVSRQELFNSTLDSLLLDKTKFIILFGFFSLFFFAFNNNVFLIFSSYCFTSWFFAILFLSTARLIEPILPLLLWGNSIGLYKTYTFIKKYLKLRENNFSF